MKFGRRYVYVGKSTGISVEFDEIALVVQNSGVEISIYCPLQIQDESFWSLPLSAH